MPFPPSPMSLPQQPHGGGGTPAEEAIRQAKQMREGAGLPPTPRSPGKNGEKGSPLGNLAVKRWDRVEEAMENFPEVYGPTRDDERKAEMVKQWKLWEAQAFDRYGRDKKPLHPLHQIPWHRSEKGTLR